MFTLGFRAIIHLRDNFEEGALEVSDNALTRLREPHSAMPHNVLPLQKLLEVHLTLLERYQRDEREHGRRVVARCLAAIREELAMYRQFVTLFPLMHGSLLIYEARFLGLIRKDSREQAAEMLVRAVELAKTSNLRIFEAMAYFELGRILPVEHEKRLSYVWPRFLWIPRG